MTRAAARNGTPIAVNSPYRSYADQVASFNGWVNVDGYDDAITYSQRPGHSEHQLGLTIDFMTLGGGSALQGDWATTPSGHWMSENAWKYGWLMSYPTGEGGALFSEATCFHYEPWHYRYLGREIARKVHRSGLTIREYLWKHYTLVDPRTGEPIATPTPTPSPTPIPTADRHVRPRRPPRPSAPAIGHRQRHGGTVRGAAHGQRRPVGHRSARLRRPGRRRGGDRRDCLRRQAQERSGIGQPGGEIGPWTDLGR